MSTPTRNCPPADSLLQWLAIGAADCRLPEVGRSVEGRPLQAWGLGQGNVSPTLLIGAFHGDEPESAWLAARYLRESAKRTEDTLPVIIVPILNPDGLVANTRWNANTVDLNRNWPTENWQAQATEDAYPPGPHPASEPETQWLLEQIERWQPRQIISLHTPYKVINPDGPADGLAQCLAQHNGYPITPDIGYPTPGSFGTYYGVERQMPVVTLELEEAPEETVWNTHALALWAACQLV